MRMHKQTNELIFGISFKDLFIYKFNLFVYFDLSI